MLSSDQICLEERSVSDVSRHFTVQHFYPLEKRCQQWCKDPWRMMVQESNTSFSNVTNLFQSMLLLLMLLVLKKKGYWNLSERQFTWIFRVVVKCSYLKSWRILGWTLAKTLFQCWSVEKIVKALSEGWRWTRITVYLAHWHMYCMLGFCTSCNKLNNWVDLCH